MDIGKLLGDVLGSNSGTGSGGKSNMLGDLDRSAGIS